MLMDDNREHCNENNNINDDTKITKTFAIIIIGILL